jgi:hypothetical protein
VRKLVTLLMVLALLAVGCSGDDASRTYGAQSAKVGESLAVLGWNVSVSNLRFEGDYVLVDVDASVAKADAPHAKPESLRFGLYGALAHPIESFALGGCADVTGVSATPASAPSPDKLGGTVCLGPLRDQSQVRGVYAYSPQDRMPGTTVAYAAAFPVGLGPINPADTGLGLKSTSVDAFRADGAQLDPTALGDPAGFNGNGYMLLGLEISGAAARSWSWSGRPCQGRGCPTPARCTERRCWCCRTPHWTRCRYARRCALRARSTRRCCTRRCR